MAQTSFLEKVARIKLLVGMVTTSLIQVSGQRGDLIKLREEKESILLSLWMGIGRLLKILS